jgi:hypothetical protein
LGAVLRRAAIAAAAILAALSLVQLALPELVERRLRNQLDDDGKVERVEIRAVPAFKLLWGRADRVKVEMRDARADRGRLADLLARTRRAGRVDVRVGEVRIVTLRLHDLRLRKRGRTLRGEASVSRADLQAALPPGFGLQPVESGGGELVLEGTVSALGTGARVRARLAPFDGRLLIQPEGIPLGGLLALTVFADDRVEVQAVGARPRGDGFTFTARARLR